MNCINTTQVQLTNDASTVSKCSAVSKNYFKDDYIEEFVEKKKSRASLIHLGYYTRAVIINKLITDFIEFGNLQMFLKFQIISCGSGFDTAYWRLSEANLLNKSIFVEIDFSDVIQRKIALIKQSQKLNSCLQETRTNSNFPGVNKMTFNYFLLEADLCDINLIESLFNEINIDYNIPTLFLSECVITYMNESDSSNFIKWICEKFKNGGFLNYEQIHPDDGFGQVMLNHFDKLQCALYSVGKYPDCIAHFSRYKNHGFQSSFCNSEWDALICLTTEEERKRVLSLELFDEFEEFHLKCVHYIIAIAGNGILSWWISSFPPANNSESNNACRPKIKVNELHHELELFRHSSCCVNQSSFLFGGCSRQSRSSKIYEIKYSASLDIRELKILGNGGIQFDMVYGTAVSFELNKVLFILLYGGRTSPNKVWSNGAPVLIELTENGLFPRVINCDKHPLPRYRSPMVCLNSSESEVSCWIFGGRTADLNQPLSDFWELSITVDTEKNFSFTWKPYERNTKNWPCNRMSHCLLANPKRFELYMIGGLSIDTSHVLNDMWKWSCRSESWGKLQLIGHLIPRYGHTAHLKEDLIYLVGGVNTLAGMQPGLGVIDILNQTVMEYEISVSIPKPVLFFNHSSELISDRDESCLFIFGGGGNCFSFGTHLNQMVLSIKLNQLRS